jgi:hypothetical protein
MVTTNSDFQKEVSMRDFIRLSQAFVYVLLVGLLSDGATAQQVPSGPSIKVCLSQDGMPTKRCLEPRRLGLQLAPIEAKHNGQAAEVDLVFEVGPDDFDMIGVLTGMSGRGEQMVICIVNGANICPPEPFKLVWMCITTGMKAGSECPEMPEDAPRPITTIRMRASSR